MRPPLVSTIAAKGINVFIFATLILAIFLRLYLYTDPRLSIGTKDTESYVSSSRAPLFSWASFSGRRLFTTNLLFKLANDPQSCMPSKVSDPRLEDGQLYLQHCFDRITLIQTFLSIISWCLLAWTVSRWMSTPLAKFLSMVLLLAFAFTPQLVEWDNLLGAESLSLSLFAFSLSFLVEIAFRVSSGEERVHSLRLNLLIAAWGITFALWVLIRDVHIYVVLITIVLAIFSFFIRKIRERKSLIVICCILVGLYVLGSISASQSSRWQPSLTHSLDTYIFPHPTRIEFFEQLGMPDRNNAKYDEWFDDKGVETYGRFLLSHPGFVISTIFDQHYYFEEDTVQEYYKTPDPLRSILISFGQILHPRSTSIYLIDALLLISICSATIRQKDATLIGWAWIGTWLFLSAFVTLLVSFFGDTAGIGRHIFPSIEMFRLFGWIFLILHIDKFSRDTAIQTI